MRAGGLNKINLPKLESNSNSSQMIGQKATSAANKSRRQSIGQDYSIGVSTSGMISGARLNDNLSISKSNL